MRRRDIQLCEVCKQRLGDENSDSNWIQCQNCLKWFHQECQGLDADYSEENCFFVSRATTVTKVNQYVN